MPRPNLLLIVPLLAVLAACDGDSGGRVELLFSLPEAEGLSPINGLAEISVVARTPGAEPRIQTVSVDNGRSEIAVGQLPPTEGVEISVELRSAQQRLIGFGRSPGLVDVGLSGTTVVPIELRRPFAYLTGERGVTAFDGTLDLRSPDYRASIGGSAAATAVATNAGGDLILVASNDGTGGGSLRAIATRDHEPVESIEVPLARPPSSVAVSPDDEYVVVTHETTEAGTGGISIALLADVVGGETPSATFVVLGNANDVAIALGETLDDAPIAMVLLDATRDCADDAPEPASSVIGVDLRNPQEALFTVSTGTALPDIAVNAPTRTLLVASPCTNQVLAVQPLSGPMPLLQELQSVPRVNAVATRDGQVVSVGNSPFREIDDPESERPEDTIKIGASLVIAQSGLDGTAATEVGLPSAEERAVALRRFENRLPAKGIFAYDLALGPGGDLVALLVRSRYEGEEVIVIDIFGERAFIPPMELISHEYQLIDLAAGTQSQRLRTDCDLAFAPGYALANWDCTSSPGQDTLRDAESFIPPHVTTLYGAR